jgi:hypothetical protein
MSVDACATNARSGDPWQADERDTVVTRQIETSRYEWPAVATCTD